MNIYKYKYGNDDPIMKMKKNKSNNNNENDVVVPEDKGLVVVEDLKNVENNANDNDGNGVPFGAPHNDTDNSNSQQSQDQAGFNGMSIMNLNQEIDEIKDNSDVPDKPIELMLHQVATHILRKCQYQCQCQ